VILRLSLIFLSVCFSSPVYAFTVTFDDSNQLEKLDGIQSVLWVQNGLLCILIILGIWSIASRRW
jgi:hypothetical protein